MKDRQFIYIKRRQSKKKRIKKEEGRKEWLEVNVSPYRKEETSEEAKEGNSSRQKETKQLWKGKVKENTLGHVYSLSIQGSPRTCKE